jgi:hypothetical protein
MLLLVLDIVFLIVLRLSVAAKEVEKEEKEE